jgi:ABC-2 type transport system ATP-binding protein
MITILCRAANARVGGMAPFRAHGLVARSNWQFAWLRRLRRLATGVFMIEVENLTKRYGRQTAVDGISFKVMKGEILGFLGPNGAGKTTTMRILTCYLPPTDGRARVAGFDVFEQPLEVKKRVGYTPETPPLYPDLEVGEFLDFCARIKGVPSAARSARLAETMEKTRITDVRGKLIGHLSKGYRQRVGLAQALLGNPEVLILDEPTAGLDPKQIIETRELIRGLGGEHTIILSTHILPEVSAVCGRVMIINKGRVVAEDTPENLTHRLRGAASLRVEVRGDEEGVLGALRAVKGVVGVRPARGSAGVAAFELDPEPGTDVRPEVARAVVGRGFDLLALQQVGMSLEDIFLHLTTTEQAAAEPAPPAPAVTAGEATA